MFAFSIDDRSVEAYCSFNTTAMDAGDTPRERKMTMKRTHYTRAELNPAREMFDFLLDGVCRAKIETQADSLELLEVCATVAARKTGLDVGYIKAGLKMIISERSAARSQ